MLLLLLLCALLALLLELTLQLSTESIFIRMGKCKGRSPRKRPIRRDR